MLNYYMPTDIYFGKNCLDRLSQIIKGSRKEKILVFTGDRSSEISGAWKEIKTKLANCRVEIFKGIKPNPTIESLTEGMGISKKGKINMIIAIGGGSVIDYAKAVSVLSGEDGAPCDFFYKKRKLKNCKIKFIAVPTTFGTSSEITPYAVMTDRRKGTKITLQHTSVFPDYAFINPDFTLTMPKPLIATSLADLLSHAIEAYWNINANGLTDNFAFQAIRLFLKHYKKTYQEIKDAPTREKISMASVYAGLAFSNTRTTACHSISYPMTTIFNIPHGIACALSLAEMLEFNSRGDKDKILKLCNIMECGDVEKAKNKISSIMHNLNIKTRLRDYGLDKEGLDIILKNGFTPERMNNNPRKVTRDKLKKILKRIY